MEKEAIIEQTVKAIKKLPDDKVVEISDFVDFISKRYDEYQLTRGIQKLAEESSVFNFLNNEEDLYSMADLKEVYNA